MRVASVIRLRPWQLTEPCQQPVDSAADGEWWAPAEELFHC